MIDRVAVKGKYANMDVCSDRRGRGEEWGRGKARGELVRNRPYSFFHHFLFVTLCVASRCFGRHWSRMRVCGFCLSGMSRSWCR